MATPINPNPIPQERHIVVSNNSTDFAIYAKDEAGTVVGRLFVNIEEMQGIINEFNNICEQQNLLQDK